MSRLLFFLVFVAAAEAATNVTFKSFLSGFKNGFSLGLTTGLGLHYNGAKWGNGFKSAVNWDGNMDFGDMKLPSLGFNVKPPFFRFSISSDDKEKLKFEEVQKLQKENPGSKPAKLPKQPATSTPSPKKGPLGKEAQELPKASDHLDDLSFDKDNSDEYEERSFEDDYKQDKALEAKSLKRPTRSRG